MATITLTYTFEIPDTLAADIRAENTVLSDGTVVADYYGCSALGAFVSSKRLPAVYRSDAHSIRLSPVVEFSSRMPAWLAG